MANGGRGKWNNEQADATDGGLMQRSISNFEIYTGDDAGDEGGEMQALELNEQAERREAFVAPQSASSGGTLPPLRRAGGGGGGVTGGGGSGHREPLASPTPGTNDVSKEEWIVPKPKRVKPRDLLRLEGPMEMKTTFATTYDAAAKEIEQILQDSLKLIDDEKEGAIAALPYGGRRSRHRPKTSLKLTGPGYYETVNRESFKKFVVVDDNNNHHSSSLKVVDKGAPGEGNFESEKVVRAGQGANDSLAKVKPSPGEVREGPRAKDASPTINTGRRSRDAARDEVVSKAALTSDPLKSSHQRVQLGPNTTGSGGGGGDHHRAHATAGQGKGETVSHLQMTSADQTKQMHMKQKEKEVTQRQVTQSTSPPCNGSCNGLLRRRRHHSLPRQMTQLQQQQQQLQLQMQQQQLQQQQQQQQYSRSLYPSERPRLRRKNDSQLKFDGDMCFETTSQSNFPAFDLRKEWPSSQYKEQLPARRAKRDLFRTSHIQSPKEEKMHAETTYSMFFRRKTHCPALDLDTHDSEYRFKNECGGHRFYFPCNRL